MDASLFANAKLRKVSGSARPVAALAITEAVELEKEQQRRLRECDLEAWYESLKENTMRTELVDLSPQEARALQARFRHKETEETIEHLERLEKRIELTMTNNQSFVSNDGVFAKLSSRSPKDSTFCQIKAMAFVKERLLRIDPATIDSNVVAEVIIQSSIDSLKLSNASEIIQCFATSDRVCEDDIPLALSFEKDWS